MRQTSLRRTLVATAAAAATMLVMSGGGAAATPAQVSPSVETTAAERVAQDFLDAYGAFDADRAMGFLTKGAIADGWRTAAQFRLELELLEATGWKQTIPECDAYPWKWDPGSIVYCKYGFQALRSGELGIGFGFPYWAIRVHKGRIVEAENRGWRSALGFNSKVWEPFRRWVQYAYPGDALEMYRGEDGSAWKRSEASVQLWDQHTREYVAAVARYAAQAEVICTAAHDRLETVYGRVPAPDLRSVDFDAYAAAEADVLEDALAELRAAPPPEPFLEQYGRAYAAGDRVVQALRGGGANAVFAFEDYPLDAPGLGECTFPS